MTYNVFSGIPYSINHSTLLKVSEIENGTEPYK